jgi:hypothetical protein
MNRALLAGLLCLSTLAPVGAQERCTHNAVVLRGTPATIDLCVTGTPAVQSGVATVPLEMRYQTRSASLVQRASIRFITGVGPSRALQSVELAPLGVAGVLHMTLLYNGNDVSMEHALLTPGAITVK